MVKDQFTVILGLDIGQDDALSFGPCIIVDYRAVLDACAVADIGFDENDRSTNRRPRRGRHCIYGSLGINYQPTVLLRLDHRRYDASTASIYSRPKPVAILVVVLDGNKLTTPRPYNRVGGD